MKDSYYITTAIPYANADPHIGNALEILYSDVMARYQRLLGNDVYFLWGTDEHGQKMWKTAKEAGRDVAEFAKEESAKFQVLADEFEISNNDFIRTTEDRHIKGAQYLWQKAIENGDIYKKSYEGLYCVGCESFKTEGELVDGLCPEHQTKPELVKEENYFFKLSKYQNQLVELIETNQLKIIPANKRAEALSFIKSGL